MAAASATGLCDRVLCSVAGFLCTVSTLRALVLSPPKVQTVRGTASRHTGSGSPVLLKLMRPRAGRGALAQPHRHTDARTSAVRTALGLAHRHDGSMDAGLRFAGRLKTALSGTHYTAVPST